MYSLLCLGNPLLDLQVDVEPAYLEKYGLKPNDAILVEDKHMPIFAEVLAMPNLHVLAGGAAQNTARGAQYMLPPDSVVYFGCVGDDEYAERLQKSNRSVGLFANYLVNKDVSTGKCAALVSDNGKNRSLATDLGAANHYQLSHLLAPENWKYAEGAKAFYIGGFHFTVCPDAINTLGKHAAATNKPFTVNFSAPFIPTAFKDAFDSSSAYWDYLIGNESEAAAYASSHDLNPADLEAIAKSIALLPKENTARPRTVIITQGTEPTLVVVAGADGKSTTTSTYPVHPLDASKVVDTNGAGDAFAGGFMAGIVKGEPLAKCIEMGHWLASKSIQQIGPAFPEPVETFA